MKVANASASLRGRSEPCELPCAPATDAPRTDEERTQLEHTAQEIAAQIDAELMQAYLSACPYCPCALCAPFQPAQRCHTGSLRGLVIGET